MIAAVTFTVTDTMIHAAFVVLVLIVFLWALGRGPNVRFAAMCAGLAFCLVPAQHPSNIGTWIGVFWGVVWFTELVTWAKKTQHDRLLVWLLGLMLGRPTTFDRKEGPS